MNLTECCKTERWIVCGLKVYKTEEEAKKCIDRGKTYYHICSKCKEAI